MGVGATSCSANVFSAAIPVMTVNLGAGSGCDGVSLIFFSRAMLIKNDLTPLAAGKHECHFNRLLNSISDRRSSQLAEASSDLLKLRRQFDGAVTPHECQPASLGSRRGKGQSGWPLERTTARREMSSDKRVRGRGGNRIQIFLSVFQTVGPPWRWTQSLRAAGASCCFCFSLSTKDPTVIYWTLKINVIFMLFYSERPQ